MVVIESFSGGGPSGSDHLSKEQLSLRVHFDPRFLRIPRSGMRNEHLREDIQSSAGIDEKRLLDPRFAPGIPCPENAGRAWAGQDDARTRAHFYGDLDAIPREKTGRGIHRVDGKIIPFPMRLAQMHGRSKRLLREKRSPRGVGPTFDPQVTVTLLAEGTADDMPAFIPAGQKLERRFAQQQRLAS